MGLDQHLYRKTFLWTGDYINEDARDSIVVTKGGKTHSAIKNDRIKYVVEEVGYWRKANHIHKWFVDNIQSGEDNCGEYYVNKVDLESLRDLCLKVKADPDKAQELLPTQGGFFFGTLDYNEDYFENINLTIEILNNVLESNDTNFDYFYTSSW